MQTVLAFLSCFVGFIGGVQYMNYKTEQRMADEQVKTAINESCRVSMLVTLDAVLGDGKLTDCNSITEHVFSRRGTHIPVEN